jgi:hypothetical protein
MTLQLRPGVCPKLRTKSMYLHVDARSDEEEPGCRGTAVFWCLLTQGPLGPDDLPVRPEDCRAGRSCSELPPEA